jgi:hypothetical protein
MKPFDDYPKEESNLRKGLRNTGNCRHGYGLDLQSRTGQTTCAYCGLSLVDDYNHWLLLCVDHVVPVSEGRHLGISADLVGGLVNQVLCCAGCNGLDNRYVIEDTAAKTDWSLDEFVKLRDETFLVRGRRIAERRAEEIAFFDTRVRAK